jgi:hypothetical protein
LYFGVVFFRHARPTLSPPTPVRVRQVRSVVLKFVTFFVFFYQVFKQRENYACWENFLGQEAYKVFVVGSLVFEIFTSVGIDFLITALHYKVPCMRGLLPQPVTDPRPPIPRLHRTPQSHASIALPDTSLAAFGFRLCFLLQKWNWCVRYAEFGAGA